MSSADECGEVIGGWVEGGEGADHVVAMCEVKKVGGLGD